MINVKVIPGAQPYFDNHIDDILLDIKDVLHSGQLTQGKHLREFEKSVASLVGTKFAVGVSSGGVALELTLRALNVVGKEVIVPTNTFVASATSVVLAGGKPVFADISRETLCLDPSDVAKKISDNTAGVMMVHMFGLVPPDLNEIKKICRERHLFLIEDAAHAHGASLAEKPAGNLGDAACFSFYATKIVTTGEGGVITTNRQDVYERSLQLRNHGRSLTESVYDIIGNNYRLAEIPAILGRYQMKDLKANIKRRNEIARHYRRELAEVKGLELLPEFADSVHGYWRFPVYLDEGIDRTALQQTMRENHKIRINWMYEPLCHLQPVFLKSHAHQYGDFPVAEACMDRLICLPNHLGLSDDDVQRVCDSLKIELVRDGRQSDAA